MKKIILLSTALFFSLGSFAQSDSTMHHKKGKTMPSEPVDMSKTDGVMMKNGTMNTVKNGKMTKMTADFTFNDGEIDKFLPAPLRN